MSRGEEGEQRGGGRGGGREDRGEESRAEGRREGESREEGREEGGEGRGEESGADGKREGRGEGWGRWAPWDGRPDSRGLTRHVRPPGAQRRLRHCSTITCRCAPLLRGPPSTSEKAAEKTGPELPRGGAGPGAWLCSAHPGSGARGRLSG